MGRLRKNLLGAECLSLLCQQTFVDFGGVVSE